MARPTMRDVAELAGVSAKTVSNVVRGWPPVSAETEERVRAALSDLDYRLNPSPESLRSGRSGTIGFAVPWLDNPYFAELTSAVVRRAAMTGLNVSVIQTDGRPERELELVSSPRHRHLDGLIYSPFSLGSEQMPESFGLPTVLLGERVGADHGDHIAIDNVTAALDAVSHLISSGRSNIALIGRQPIPGAVNARLRSRGYELALRAAGLELDAMLQETVVGVHRSDGANAMDRLLGRGREFDAVFCLTDTLALGAMHAALAAGLSVPGDVAIAGFDDIDDGRFANPGLTTISPDKDAIARLALEQLSLRMDGQGGATSEFIVSHRLVVRGSTL